LDTGTLRRRDVGCLVATTPPLGVKIGVLSLPCPPLADLLPDDGSSGEAICLFVVGSLNPPESRLDLVVATQLNGGRFQLLEHGSIGYWKT